jgi:hypothetical protein
LYIQYLQYTDRNPHGPQLRMQLRLLRILAGDAGNAAVVAVAAAATVAVAVAVAVVAVAVVSNTPMRRCQRPLPSMVRLFFKENLFDRSQALLVIWLSLVRPPLWGLFLFLGPSVHDHLCSLRLNKKTFVELQNSFSCEMAEQERVREEATKNGDWYTDHVRGSGAQSLPSICTLIIGD